jgi:glycine betaine/proline transport system substrate-binding protein
MVMRILKYGRISKVMLLLSVAVLALVAMACTSEEEKPTIKLADTQFESLWINNAIFKFVVENGYGYPVETIEMTTPIMQVSLAPNGDIHLMMEMWQQNIIDWYNEETAAGTLINVGMAYEGGPQFFTIPQYVHEQYGIHTVEDMKEHWELFKDPEDDSKGLFINCAIGWQCAEINRAKFAAYGLDEYYNILSPGAAAAMDAALSGAQIKSEPVFGYYWAPTSLMGMYDWYVLEEPAYTDSCWEEVIKGTKDDTYIPKDACAYETLPVDKGIHSSLLELAPDVVEMLKKMNVGLQPINVTAAWAVENDIQSDWEKAAIYYLQNYEDRWTTWMPASEVQKVKDALAATS